MVSTHFSSIGQVRDLGRHTQEIRCADPTHNRIILFSSLCKTFPFTLHTMYGLGITYTYTKK